MFVIGAATMRNPHSTIPETPEPLHNIGTKPLETRKASMAGTI